MDGAHFDDLVRRLHSRRTALAGLLGGLATILGVGGAQETAAHNLRPACRRIADR